LAIMVTKSGSDERIFVSTGGGTNDGLVGAVGTICVWISDVADGGSVGVVGTICV
jgi:hypothetical protein